MALILEVLDGRTGEVRARHGIDTATVSVGRGWDHDVVLDDPYVDVRHARIAFDEAGAPVIDDLGSVNGLVGPDRTRASRIALRPGTVVRVGRTRLRFQDTDAPLPPALADPHLLTGRFRLPAWTGTVWAQLGVLGVAAAMVAWTTWLGTYRDDSATATMGGVLAFLAIVTPWAGIWAIASRIVVQRFRFLAHVAVASLVTVAGIVYARAGAWGTFVFPDSPLADPLSVTLALLIVAALIAFHLALASHLPARRRWGAGVATAAVIFAIGLAFTLADDDAFTDVPEFAGVLRPLPVGLLPTGTAQDFGAVAEDLRREVDALVKETE